MDLTLPSVDPITGLHDARVHNPNAIGHSVRRYLQTPVESWTWPRTELQPAFDFCSADLAYFRRPLNR